MPIHLRDYQKECIEKKRSLPNSLIKMWCGTGKTRIFTTSIIEFAFLLNVIVFPSLGLINQYNNDYVNNHTFEEYWYEYEILSFCSAEEPGKKKSSKKIKYTTSEQTLKTFLRKKGKKLITVTYQSFQKFVEIIKNTQNRINYLIYDEAHHTVGSQIQNVVYKDVEFKQLVDRTEYYTATPINRNGIIMYDRDEPEKSNCGPLAFEYNKAHAETDGYSRKYDVVLDLSVKHTNADNKYHHIFASIIRTCLSGEYDYWNILTFHAGVNDSKTRQNSAVKEFANRTNQSYVRKLFKKIQDEEFPETKDTIKEISLIGVHSKTRNREQILTDFDRKVPGRTMILSSCQTIGEGINTKWANMEVPVDPTKSISNTMQKIGRITRKPEPDMPNSILLLPVSVDPEKYKEADKKEKQDELFRRELNEQGDFNTLLNVISAFKYQMDSKLYDLCLTYPNMYSPDEVKNNLKKQGFVTFENQGILSDNVNYLLNDKQELDECIVEDDTQSLENIASRINKPIIVHTQNYDEPIKTYNEESAEAPIHLFCDKNGEYFPVKPKDKKDIKKRVNPPKKKEKLFTIKTNPEFRMLWGITDESLRNALETGMGRGILDCEISWDEKREENWYETLEKVKEFIDSNNKLPLRTNKSENSLIRWIDTQKQNYNKHKNIMKLIDIKTTWENFINDPKYKHLFISKEEVWFNKLFELKKWINKNKRKPTDSRTKYEKSLLTWLTMNNNSLKNEKYHNKAHIMHINEIKIAWEEFVKDEHYKKYFKTYSDKWYGYFDKLKQFIDKYNRRPSKENANEKNLGTWTSNQVNSYKNHSYVMKDKTIKNIWKEFINDPKYKKHFMSKEEIWFDNLKRTKEFMDKTNKRPSGRSKNKDEKRLGEWITGNNSDFKKCDMIKERIKHWKDFINDPKYRKHFMSNEEIWFDNLKRTKVFMDKNNKRPSVKSKNKDEKSLGYWIDDRKKKYKHKQMSKTRIPYWEEFINDPKYKAILEGKSPPAKPSAKSVNIKPKAEKEGGATKSSGNKHSKKEWQKIGKKMSMQTSKNTQEMFKKNPEMWEQYHANRDESFKGYKEQDEIPVNKITNYLGKKTKHKLKILDLGCGRNHIKEAFKENKKFTITGYDHVSCNGSVACDISKLPEEDESVNMCIFSQSLMGHNWKDYLQEAERVLMYNGEMIISESIERYQQIKDVILEMGLHIKIDDYSETKRWFYIHAIKD